MNLIASADRYWGIGLHGRLLVSIPEDMKFFRKMTTGGAVIMGRRTLESFPSGKPLPQRLNIVLTQNEAYQADGAVIVHSPAEALQAAASYETDKVWVIGGESIYRLMLPYCDTAYITRIDYAYQADTHFPDLEEDPDWELAEEGEEHTCFDLIYHMDIYKRKKPDRKEEKKC